MPTRWQIDDEVRVIRNVRNDGTFSGAGTGDLLVRRGSVGQVIDIGTFLQDQIIYSVQFYDERRVVGCREEELIGLDEEWIPSRHEFGEKVRCAKALMKDGEILVPLDSIGEIIKVVRDAPGDVAYHVHFTCLLGRVLMVPESALASLTAPIPAPTPQEES